MKSQTKIILVLFLLTTLLIPVGIFGLVYSTEKPVQIPLRSGIQVNFPGEAVNYSGTGVRGAHFAAALPESIKDLDVLSRSILRNFHPQEKSGDKFVFGGTYTLEEGETLDGNLLVLGGIATVEAGSLVEGDVVLMGGTVEINGTVEGEVVALGGLLSLGSTAVIEGDVSVIAGNIDRESGAQVYGDVKSGVEGPLSITVPGGLRFPVPGGGRFPDIQVSVNPFWEGLWLLLRSVLWAAVAVLVVLFLPKNTQRVGEAAVKQAPISGGIGCLTLFIFPIILVITAITIIGIPITILTVLLLILVIVFGVISVGTETGKRLGSMMNYNWTLAVSAGVGTFLVSLVVDGIRLIVPCLGAVGWAVVVVVGIGSVILTRFGTQTYPPDAEIDQEPETQDPNIESEEGSSVLPPPGDAEQQDLSSESESPPDTSTPDEGAEPSE